MSEMKIIQTIAGMLVGVLVSFLFLTFETLGAVKHAGPALAFIGYFAFCRKARMFASGLLWSIPLSIVLYLLFVYAALGALNGSEGGILNF